MTDATFDTYEPIDLDLDAMSADYKTIRADLAKANSPQERKAAIERWDVHRRRVNTWEDTIYIRFSQNTTDPDRKALKSHVDEIKPKIAELDVGVMRDLVESAHRAELEEAYGTHAFALWESALATYEPKIQDDMVEEGKLVSQYMGLLGGASVEWQGEQIGLTTLMKYREDSDRDVRHAAQKAIWGWCQENEDELESIFDRLVALRHGMAVKLGYENFIELGYRRMSRVDYNQHDVERFRKQVREKVVPLIDRLRKLQAERLGLDSLKAWDLSVFSKDGNPEPCGDAEWMTAQAATMFERLDPRMASFFEMLRERRLLDLEIRDGKAPGGFCAFLPDFDAPFIYANFNKTSDDARVFTHEAGHAFQSWSSRTMPLLDYVWPTYEGAEIHSMSLEHLTSPHMELFFEDRADEFRWNHLAGGLTFMPFGCLGDHFQHAVYANPTATPAERREIWRDLAAQYAPNTDWGDLDFAASGGRWMLIPHVFHTPFYFLDYVLALTCALQFWVAAEEDHAATMTRYVDLCQRGGSMPFQSLLATAGLRSPFAEGCLDGVLDKLQTALFED